jgi:hypothetical protein
LLFLTSVLLIFVAVAFGFSRRPWWQVGALALLTCGPLQFAPLWVDDWRYRVGLAHQAQSLDFQVLSLVLGWLLLCSYAGYGLGVLSARWVAR